MVQSTGDAIVSPVAILTSHAEDEFGDLACEDRSARIETVPGPIKLLSDKLTEPSQDSVRPWRPSPQARVLDGRVVCRERQEWTAPDQSIEVGKVDGLG